MNAKILAASVAAVLATEVFSVEVTDDPDGLRVGGYGSFDLSSGYVLYGMRFNDQPCYWTYQELTTGYGAWGDVGISLWQNTDMTRRRAAEMRRMNEWDWSAFYRNEYEFMEGWKLTGEIGHVWYKYHGLVDKNTYKTMEEFYFRSAVENPYLTPYYEFYYDHAVYKGAFMQGGLRRDIALPLDLTLTPDLTLGGGSRNYLACEYPPYDGSVKGGLSYFQASLKLSYWFNDHVGVHARVAWVSMLRDPIRDAIRDYGRPYAEDHVWGSVGIDWAF